MYQEDKFQAPLPGFSKPPKPKDKAKEKAKEKAKIITISDYDESEEDDEDMIAVPRRVLMEICRDSDLAKLPSQLRKAIAKVTTMAAGESSQHNHAPQPATHDAAQLIVSDNPGEGTTDLMLHETGQILGHEQPTSQETLEFSTKNLGDTLKMMSTDLLGDPTNGQKFVQGINCTGKDTQELGGQIVAPPSGATGVTGHPEGRNKPAEQAAALLEQVRDQDQAQPHHLSPPREESTVILSTRYTAQGTMSVSDGQLRNSAGAESEEALNGDMLRTEEAKDISQPLVELRRSVRKKRKTNFSGLSASGPMTNNAGQGSSSGPMANPAGPSNSKGQTTTDGPSMGVKERDIGLVKNSDGFYSVHVAYSHCKGIAEGCGLKPDDVLMVVNEDNCQRELQPQLAESESDEEKSDQEDPDSNANRPNSHLHFDNSEDESEEESEEESAEEEEDEGASERD